MLEAPSLFEIACLVRDEARKIADQVDHPNRKYRHERGGAARIISEAIGAPYSESKLKRSGCPHAVIQGVELYADEHLIELARHLLDDAKLVAA